MDLAFKVISVDEAIALHLRPEYIFTTNGIDSRFAAKKFPNSKIILPERQDTDEIYNVFMSNLPELQKVYESLIDEESRRTFRGYWLGNVSNQLNEIVHSDNPHYLTPGFIPQPGAIIIDGGSYDGGTPMRFTERGFKVYAFEMDRRLFELARKVGKEKKFTVENLGLGSYKHQMNYMPLNGGSTHVDASGSEVANITTIDSYVREKNIPRIDMIKLDVEGEELNVLKGAAVTICRFKPILYLSAYHKWNDFWVLMNYVKSLNADYEFAMRQYHVSIEDEPFVIRDGWENMMNSLGLDLCYKNYNECCLLAR